MEKELWKGNEAIAEAAIRAGCDCFFGYPITPQSEVPEYMSAHLPKAGGVFLQSESEVAAINMVYGAAGAGMRAMTSSSSPGISLKQEGITYIAGAEDVYKRQPVFLSGLENGVTCGAPLCAVIENGDQHSSDYDALQDKPRPGHADYTAFVKWGGQADMRLSLIHI